MMTKVYGFLTAVVGLMLLTGCASQKLDVKHDAEQIERAKAIDQKEKMLEERSLVSTKISFKDAQKSNDKSIHIYRECVFNVIMKIGYPEQWPIWRIIDKSVEICKKEYDESVLSFVDYRYYDQSPSFRKEMYGHMEGNDHEAAKSTVTKFFELMKADIERMDAEKAKK